MLYLAPAFNESDKPTLTFDDVSLYHPDDSVAVTVGGTGDVELWQDLNGNTADDGYTAVGASSTGNFVGTFQGGSVVHIPQGVLRGSTNRFYVSVSGDRFAPSANVALDRARTPEPVLTSPSDTGGGDFATEVRSNPWDMNENTDVAATFNTTASVHDGQLFGAIGGNPNDPVVVMDLGARQIDATLYHKVVFTASYDGPFGLEDAPGGGLVGRIIWRGFDGNHQQVSYPFVVLPGRHTYVIDLRTNPAAALVDPAGNSEFIGWGHGWTTFVDMLRIDPHEDPGGRSWQIDDVKLLRDETVSPTFDIGFRDDSYAPGTTATIYVDTNRSTADGLGTPIASGITVQPGQNTFTWNGAGVGAGAYFVHVTMQRAGRSATASSSGQVSSGLSGYGPPPATIAVVPPNSSPPGVAPPAPAPTAAPAPSTGPTPEQITAFYRFIIFVKFVCGVARSRNMTIGAAPICNSLLGSWAPVRSRARRAAPRHRRR
ncbi:MAG: hypothetical protein R2698_08255 [Microthrixaceae bacterium]